MYAYESYLYAFIMCVFLYMLVLCTNIGVEYELVVCILFLAYSRTSFHPPMDDVSEI